MSAGVLPDGVFTPEPGSLGDMLPPHVLAMAVKSGAAFNGAPANEVAVVLHVHFMFVIDELTHSKEAAESLVASLDSLRNYAADAASRLPSGASGVVQ